MEHQLGPKSPKIASWVDDKHGEDEEEEELGVSLLPRHSRHPTIGVGTTSSSFTITSGELERATLPDPAASADAIGTTTSERYDQEEERESETADKNRGNEEVVDVNEEDKAVKGEGDGIENSVYFDKVQGTDSISGISEMHSENPKILSLKTYHQQVKNVEDQNFYGLRAAPIEQLNREANTSYKQFDNATKADVNVDLIGKSEEELMELDVERVLETQNTHDLYCPNCNSCITRRVILRRRKPKISNIHHKSKRGKKLDPIPSSVGDGRLVDTPEVHPNATPSAAHDEQNNGTEQDQEAFSCLSCFSLFIPIGNGCFKIFQFFRQGRQTESTRSQQETGQRESTQSPKEIFPASNTQSPQEISTSETIQSPLQIRQDKTQSPQGKILNETTETPQKVSHNEDTQSPSKISGNEDTQSPQSRSHDENMDSPQYISHNEDALGPQHINEDTQIHQKISHNQNTTSPQSINQNENKQSPQRIPTAKTNWIFSFFGFHKNKAAVEKGGHATSVQSAAVPTLSITNGEHVDGATVKPKESAISGIFSSTNSSIIGKVKAVSWKKKPYTDVLERNAGKNEIIEDIEAGRLEPTFSPRTEVAPSSQSRTQDEHRDADAGEAQEWEILKSIVYGGLIESITSLGVVSSAAGAGADTLNVLALGVANLIGGLLVISHNLRELKNGQPRGASTEINNQEDRYQALLGRRRDFALHVTVAITSFLIFGLVPPVVYGFSFRKSDDKDLKLAAVAGASLACIILLALGKGHVQKPRRTYFRTLSYYVFMGITASGISYVVGELINKLLEKLGLFESSSAVSMRFLEPIALEVGRASY